MDRSIENTFAAMILETIGVSSKPSQSSCGTGHTCHLNQLYESCNTKRSDYTCRRKLKLRCESSITDSVLLTRSWRTFSKQQLRLWACLVFFLVLLSRISATDAEVFLNQWAVEIHGGHEVAERVAVRHGFKNLGQVCVTLNQ